MFMSASGHLDELLIGPFRVPMGPSQATMTPSWAVLARCRHVAVCDTARPALLPLPAPQEANHRDIRRRWVLQSGCTAARHKHRAGLSLPCLCLSIVPGCTQVKARDDLCSDISGTLHGALCAHLAPSPNATGTAGGLGSPPRLGPDATVHACISLLRCMTARMTMRRQGSSLPCGEAPAKL